tara:strand:+ start:1632 stop:1895 length:264 start_codon:yes stop_codon:yes gene_type:complete
MPKKKKCVNMKQCEEESMTGSTESQHRVPESVKKYQRIDQKEVFGSKAKGKPTKATKTKVPKGSHRMPDGSIMKDSAMKNKKSKKSY